jgi:flagellar hook-basal body complex protein FliE
MANELAGLIKADLAALQNAAHNLAAPQVAPAALLDGSAGAGPSFSQSMQEALGRVNNDDRMAAERMSEVDSGKSDDLVGAMLASQQASLSFSMLMQVRNKVMGAVDELIKLPL